jgi:hypothetical protein
MLVGAVVYYSTSLRPAQSRLKAIETDYETQRTRIMQMATKPESTGPSPVKQAEEALSSLERFRTGSLTQFATGRIDLINEINALTKKHGLALTSGIDMSRGVLEGENPAEKRASKKADQLQSVFPSLFVRMTVFGQYPSLRAFMADLERNKSFLVISSMSLVNQEARASSGRGARSFGAGGIALTIEMWAYFRPVANS